MFDRRFLLTFSAVGCLLSAGSVALIDPALRQPWTFRAAAGLVVSGVALLGVRVRLAA